MPDTDTRIVLGIPDPPRRTNPYADVPVPKGSVLAVDRVVGDNISQAFAELRVRLDQLEVRPNPLDEDLHCCPPLADLKQTRAFDSAAHHLK